MGILLNHHDSEYLASNEDVLSTAAAVFANMNHDGQGFVIDNMEGEHDEFTDALKTQAERRITIMFRVSFVDHSMI